jgi:hypothetical protein
MLQNSVYGYHCQNTITMSSKKDDKEVFRIFMPVENNRLLPCAHLDNTKVQDKVKELFNITNPFPNIHEYNAWNDIFFHPDAIAGFQAIEDNEKDRYLFIQRLIQVNLPNYHIKFIKMNVVKEGDEKRFTLTTETMDIAMKQISTRLSKICKSRMEVAKKLSVPYDSNNKKTDIKDIIIEKNVVTLRQNLDFIKNIHHQCYDRSDVIQNFNESWTGYSAISTIYEPVDFIVYSGSHAIHKHKVVHECTKVRLRFPKNKSYLLLFHGKLIHNGARALPESDLTSFNYMKSLRLFSYVNKNIKHQSNEDYPLSDNVDEESSINGHYTPHKDDSNHHRMKLRSANQKDQAHGILYKVDTSVKTCKSCKTCQEILFKKPADNWSLFGADGMGCMDIDVQLCHDKLVISDKKKQRNQNVRKSRQKKKEQELHQDSSTADSNKPLKRRKVNPNQYFTKDKFRPIVGNLERDGWVVYEGIDLSNMELYGSLRNELNNTMNTPFRGMWKPIDSHPGASRDSIKLKVLATVSYDDYLKHIYILFNDILENCVKKIPGFEDAYYESHQLLRNVNDVYEQPAHGDYPVNVNTDSES